jgi:hypothetical protein
MKISEAQIMQLIRCAYELDKHLEFNGNLEWSAEIAELLDNINKQQSEEFKEIE